MSIPFNLENENAGAFTYHLSFSFGYTLSIPCSFKLFPSITNVPISAKEYPVAFDINGTVLEDSEFSVNTKKLERVLGDGKTVGEILADQLANGQDNYSNPYSALYDPTILTELLKILILLSAFGALMNVIPYFWYDFNEKKQESVIRVLKIRAMFEDYGNGILDDEKLVEGNMGSSCM